MFEIASYIVMYSAYTSPGLTSVRVPEQQNILMSKEMPAASEYKTKV